ncbi:hypothetical protein IQ260_22295 [Leptolyngbya cf. ectocarpi LEGE 11479]|uniref:Uncharacterized protein n=1 Tax=Leptolyngbya cf. ectocarpi LEGE 11479 TaxID=1828722 RepID=A0A928ZXM2_LEPEC|nr:hypothetical protein [Leptolyngbya ectocarpi]MBE9069379.1 hypothetical protein [Leptolyngbya cf. ectocarpi LEGE 11479]
MVFPLTLQFLSLIGIGASPWNHPMGPTPLCLIPNPEKSYPINTDP